MEACHVKGGQGSCKSIPQIPVGKLAYQNCNRDLSPRGGRAETIYFIARSTPIDLSHVNAIAIRTSVPWRPTI